MDTAATAAKVKKEKELRRIQLEKEYALAKVKESAFKEILDEEYKLNTQTKPEDKELSPQQPTAILTRIAKQEMNPNIPPFVPNMIPDNFGQQQANNAQNFEQSSSISFALNQLVNLQTQR